MEDRHGKVSAAGQKFLSCVYAQTEFPSMQVLIFSHNQVQHIPLDHPGLSKGMLLSCYQSFLSLTQREKSLRGL